jgi:hypothetical protein
VAEGRRVMETSADALEAAGEGTLLKALTTEMELLHRAGDGGMVGMSCLTAFQVIGLLQLALRHQGLGPEVRRTGEGLIRDLADWFEEYPACSLVIRRGNDPREDLPANTGPRIILP